jgi:hypothetical protein
MVLMAMKLLTFDDQLVLDFSAHDDDDNLIILNIIQRSEASDTQFEPGQWVRPQPFDGSRFGGRLVLKPSHNGRFKNPLITRRQ